MARFTNPSGPVSKVKHLVKNGSTPLSKGTPVYISGASGTNMIVGVASNTTEALSSKTVGIVEQNLAANQTGYVVTEGLLTNIDTNGSNAGDPIWLGVSGGKVYGLANKPQAPAHLVYLGVVTRANTNTGEIFISIQNGFEVAELHDVKITNPQDGQTIKYQASTGLWVNSF